MNNRRNYRIKTDKVPQVVYAGGFTNENNPNVTFTAYYPNGKSVELVITPDQAATLISGWTSSLARSAQKAS